MKKVPKGNKGLGKLPTAVRNKMGYKQMGGSTSADQTYTKLNLKKDGSVKKYKEISKKNFDRKSKRYSNQKGSNTLGSSSSKAQQVVSGKNPNKSVTRRSANAMMSMGGEKLLTKMTYGGAYSDMTDPMVKRMQMGGSTHSGKSTTKKSKKPTAKPWIQDPTSMSKTPSRPRTPWTPKAPRSTAMRMDTPYKKKKK